MVNAPKMTPTPRDLEKAREIVEACDHAFRDPVAAACELCIATALAAREAETREECAKIAENPYSDEVQAVGGRLHGDEPAAVGKKIAAAIRASAS